MPADVADPDQVFAVADRVEAELGAIDIWVNVAFTSVFSPFDQIEPGEYRRVTEVSYLGYIHGTMAALSHMKRRDRGTIVQVGSALAYRGIPLQSAYCGPKHAIQGFHEALRCELLHDKSNVHVTMVQLPAVNTPQFSWVLSRLPHHAQPVPPIYQPEFATRAVLYAADHPRRREYWVGASTMATLAANALAPGSLDRYLGKTGFGAQQTCPRAGTRSAGHGRCAVGAAARVGAARRAHRPGYDSDRSPGRGCCPEPGQRTRRRQIRRQRRSRSGSSLSIGCPPALAEGIARWATRQPPADRRPHRTPDRYDISCVGVDVRHSCGWLSEPDRRWRQTSRNHNRRAE
jgi:NAD(P)-dependent dehydrogenase (short-subunit alcohol dehydrogenase family)